MTGLVLGFPAGAEWIIIVIALLLIFGGSRLAGLGKGAGRAVREFKEETDTLRAKKSPDALADGSVPTTVAVPQPQAQPMTTEAAPARVVEAGPDAPDLR